MESDARATLEKFHEKGNNEDLDGLMECIHDDFIASLTNQDLLKGKEAFRKAYATILSAFTDIYSVAFRSSPTRCGGKGRS